MPDETCMKSVVCHMDRQVFNSIHLFIWELLMFPSSFLAVSHKSTLEAIGRVTFSAATGFCLYTTQFNES